VTPVNYVWNRACEGGGGSPQQGDRALAALIAFHSLAMNGGVLDACECLGAEGVSASAAGYRFFGLDSVADLVLRAKEIAESRDDLAGHEARLDRDYASLVPDDAFLARQFEDFFNRNPGDFAGPQTTRGFSFPSSPPGRNWYLYR
jgi:hypothetical protein